jgi:hypothetical protein
MARRPLTFGLKFRDQGRTVRVRASKRNPQRYVVEDRRVGSQGREREHASLSGALRDFASTWRGRLN